VPLTIVMYHYVRDGARVHARTVAELEAQLDFVAQSHEVLTLADVVRGEWPADGCLLTFDDGLVEHLEIVAPALERRGLTGVFSVPARPVLERRPLDVQKTQFLLATVDDHAALGRELLELADVEDGEGFRARNTPSHRYDAPETVFVKRALQEGLPDDRRRDVLDALFREHVTGDERAFADELYLTVDGCRELVRRGHTVIGHGDEHRRLGLLGEAEQRSEIERSRELVELVGGTWAFCYPYGSRNETTLRLLRASGCRIGLTTDVGVAGADADPLQLPRLDTNDLPPVRNGHDRGQTPGMSGTATTAAALAPPEGP
jgi:peptidoglycan/xylan/chitin deacetylase (PgdA/CDA1 family)